MRVLAFSLALVGLVHVRDASACKCGRQSLEDALAGGHAVFSAHLGTETKRGDNYEYAVTVDKVWKGHVKRTFVMHMGSNGGDCSMGQLDGKVWLFITDAQLDAHICGGSRQATPALLDDVTKQLGAPHEPNS